MAYCTAGLYATPVGLNVAPNLITVAPYSERFLQLSLPRRPCGPNCGLAYYAGMLCCCS